MQQHGVTRSSHTLARIILRILNITIIVQQITRVLLSTSQTRALRLRE